MPGKTRKPSPPPGLGPDGRRLWRDVLAGLEIEPWETALLAAAARTADAEARLLAVAVDPEVSDSERRRADAEAGRQRVILGRLIDQLAPDGPVPAKTVPTRLRRLDLRRDGA